MNTEITISGESLQLSGSEEVVFSFISYDLLNLGTRSASYSNVFKIPATQTNRDILDLPEVITNVNDSAYRRLPAKILVDDIEFVSGNATIEGFDGTNYDVSIKSGDGNFFSLIKELSLADLSTELRALNHIYNVTDVEARRDRSSGIVYPNIDYGYFEGVTLGDQPYNFFLPSLYVKFLMDAAIEKIGYNTIGDFWESDIYSRLAIPAKRVNSQASNILASYTFIDETIAYEDLQAEVSSVSVSRISNELAPLNFPEEIEDEEEVYNSLALGLGYTVFGYEFPAPYSTTTQFNIDFSARFVMNLQPNFFIERFVNDAEFVINVVLYNKNTGNREGLVYSEAFKVFQATYATYVDPETFDIIAGLDQQLFYQQVYDINIANSNPNLLSDIAANADDFAMVWEIQSNARIDSLWNTQGSFDPNPELVPMLEGFSFQDIVFAINQNDNLGIPSEVDIPSSFEDINLGELFLYVNNVTGVYPIVDETNKTIKLEPIDNVKRNKTNAFDWSDKIDIDNDPTISFSLDGFAQNNYLDYSNDSNDPFLEVPENFGRGTITVNDSTLPFSTVKYQAPYSLVAVRPTFIGGARAMGRIFSGEKYSFLGGNVFELKPDAKVEPFADRIVLLSRSTANLIQIENGTGVTANYEVSNNPILFSNVIRNRFTIFDDIVAFPKVVKADVLLNSVEAQNQENSVVWIDYFNAYFYINEKSEYNLTSPETTSVTLIRI